ncbi:MAG: FAD-dependent oxidoreductase, partial [Microthrixaceae bacterium]|nr:FAD-dependent oxidoreductase [Microthrixaceae bacterium]
MSLRFVIVGAGPAGTQAATTAARLGADVTLIERDIVGGAAHLLDCVPSKSMIATAEALDDVATAAGMGLQVAPARLDLDALRARIESIVARLEQQSRDLLGSQGVDIVRGTGRLVDPHTVV